MTAPATIPDCGCGGACPCSCPTGPWPISNSPGLRTIAYRVGDFSSFRRALVAHLGTDVALAGWNPSTLAGDLGLQILDWWSYLADILTFYNERAANEAYLATADLPQSVSRLVSVLGYRPRPGIGATVTLAALAASPASIAIPAGFAVSSKATPVVPSQVFELATAVSFLQPTSVPQPAPDQLGNPSVPGGPPPGSPAGAAEVPAHPQLIARGGVLVAKTPSKVAAGDQLVLLPRDFAGGSASPAVLVSVTGTVPETDPQGSTNTRVLLDASSQAAVGSSALAGSYRLARPSRSDHLATIPAGATVISSATLVLAAADRSLKAGDPLLVTTPGNSYGSSYGSGYAIVRLSAYDEQMWYANPPTGDLPSTPPSTGAVPLVVASLTVAAPSGADLVGAFSSVADQVSVQSGFSDVGTLIDTPVSLCSSLPASVTLPAPLAAGMGTAKGALVVGADGSGAVVSVTASPGSRDVALTPAASSSSVQQASGTFVPPLRLLFDLLELSRGKTVAGELVGTGDATQVTQDFKLSQSPVTYLSDPASLSGDGYSSTITLEVNGVIWTEVPMFFGQAPGATVFCTYEDEAGSTHVVTGDGIQGARLPSGAAVVAAYRVGSGAATPPPGSLNVVLSPVTNLAALANPVAPTGGADPDQASKIRTDAPSSVLTFGRAISLNDYAAVAASAGGVTRAKAVFEWDPDEQRPIVVVYVGDDSAALQSARAALSAEVDPNRPFLVVGAVRRSCSLRLGLVVDSSRDPATVLAAATAALVDPDAGLFASGVLRLSEVLYRSRIEEAVLVPGARAVHRLRLRYRQPSGYRIDSGGPRFDPGAGGYFVLPKARLHLHQAGTDG